MELNEEERYAVASLFTLALHASQFDGGSGIASAEPWGEPPAVQQDVHALGELSEAQLEGWWGYDLVAPGGLLDRIYRELQVAPTKWRGLKLLPAAAPSAGDDFFRQMVRGLIAMLDADLAAALPPLVVTRAPSRLARAGGDSPASQRRAVRDDLFEGLLDSESEDDEDWRGDLEREQKLQISQEAEEVVMRISARVAENQQLHPDSSEDLQQDSRHVHHPLEAIDEQDVQQGPDSPHPQEQPKQGGQGMAGTAIASPKAMGAVWELVQCCVGAAPMPPAPGQPKLPRPLAVRWYDARARVALLTVAGWLQVPGRKVANLELLLTHGDRAPKHKALSSLEEDAWERRMRYFKVGAAAVGGGALFAVTGGLAAPAIAAGVGSILGFIGAPTAIAGTVTGFLASTAAGAATVTTTMAASGAASTGTRMAYRTGEVSEFGFRELLPIQQQQQPAQPMEQELQPLSKLSLDANPHSADEPTVSGSLDPGHLQAGSNHMSARARALQRASSSSLKSNGSSGSLHSTGGSSTDTARQQQQQQGPKPEVQPEVQSTWQRWFGTTKKEEELLLPVPMRARRIGDVKLAVNIYVAGWITQRKDYELTWQSCITAADADCFTLVWESQVLLHLNSALGKLLTMQAASQGIQLATHSFLYAGAGLVAALGPTVLLGTASGLLISNAWAVASDRAVKAGKVLAHLLLSGAHGDRPVTLVAHGMGARLVFHCLLELCRQGARGVVQHAVLMGAPVGVEAVRWRMARRAVAGRLVNCYTRKDWLLGVCAGGSSGWMKATAGLVPIEDVPGVENANLSNMVDGHLAYLDEVNMESIIDMLSL